MELHVQVRAACYRLARRHAFTELVYGHITFIFHVSVRGQTVLRAGTPESNCPPVAPHPSPVALGLCIRRRS